ncbi:MAG: type I glutamate--ammonia ligase [Candidatus Dormibacteria bacterium]
MTPKEALALAEARGARMVDYRFIDLPGTWQHFSAPIHTLDAGTFKEGVGFDGSSIRGFQEIQESDMLLLPDPATAHVDPFYAVPTLVLTCDVVEPGTFKPYSRDPRHIARKAEAYLVKSKVADIAYFGPEAEFFIFDDVRYESSHNVQFASVDSAEGFWNSADDSGFNLGHKLRNKEGYFPAPPADSLQDLRTEMVLHMMDLGIDVEAQHHEVATAGQAEIDMRFQPLLRMADQVCLYKYICKNTARQHGKSVTFMPKPIFGDNGSGMHVHVSLWKGGKPLFHSAKGYAQLSDMALSFAAGLLTHAPAILAFAAPTTNSYKRLVPGFEAPVNLVLSARNRSAAVRVPMYSDNPKAKRLEFRPPDPAANPYLTFSAMLMAGLDGVRRKLDLTKSGFGPLEKNIYELGASELRKIKSVPGSLDEALAALDRDREFLLEGGVFTDDLVDTYIDYKTQNEANQVRLRPHPKEFELYYDA